jgi:peptidyl-prolyl cis-trans isomerase D
MLRGLRKASANWLGKTVMAVVVGFLIVAFGIWGIGDIFRGFGLSTVAKVGATEITMDQFRDLYNDRLQQIGRQFNKAFTSDQARALGVDRQLLAQLMAQAALDDRARRMQLGISNDELGRQIREDPTFRGLSGQFDQERFQEAIRLIGYTEQRFVAEKRRDAVRAQLISSLVGGVATPKVAADAFNRYENEERSIDYVRIDGSKVGDIPQPTDEQLTAYFNDHKFLFRAPEYRKVTILSVDPEELAKSVDVSDADLQKEYDFRRDRYTTPEQRQVQQIVFPNEDDARKAADRISAGTSFDTIITERGLKPSDTDLGLVAKSAILDPAIAEAAFALKPGAVSAPVQGRFGTALVRVTKIEPEKVRTFEEVKTELKHDLALTRTRGEVADLHDKVEDERAGGARLDEIGQKLKLPVRTLDAVDRSGRGADGQLISGLPNAQELLSGAFSADVNAQTDPLQTSGGGLIWFEVNAIEPSHDRPLAEVKDRVVSSWRDSQIADRVTAKATEIADKLKGGAAFKDLAAANGLKIENAKGLKRAGSEALPASVIEAVFRTAKDGVGDSPGKDPTEHLVFRVTDVTEPPFDATAPDAKRISDAMTNAITDELLSQYVARLEADLGTTVNGSALNQATGGSGSD